MENEQTVVILERLVAALREVRLNLDVIMVATSGRDDLGIVMAWDTTHAAIASAYSSVNTAIERVNDDLAAAKGQ